MKKYGSHVNEIIIGGGGGKNQYLMKRLRENLSPVEIVYKEGVNIFKKKLN